MKHVYIRDGRAWTSQRDEAGRTLQPIVMDAGIPRFQGNAIVRFLLDHGGFDLNDLARMNFSDVDRAQFAQLIGYSVNGWGELSYVSLFMARHADAIADALIESKCTPTTPTAP